MLFRSGSIRTLCERVVWLDKGRLVEQGDVFPVTGRYMEFMFQDEKTEEEILHAEIASQQVPDAPQSVGMSAAASDIPAEVLLDTRPVTHWGSHKGSIVSAAVLDADGERKNVHYWNTPIEVRIELCIPAEVSRQHLSVAFSIKDLQGSDLIVSTTHDFSEQPLPEAERFTISFRLTNYLLTGKYLLVAALENRQHSDIHYYEYVEGAHYFSSLSDARLFGRFQPPITHTILLK